MDRFFLRIQIDIAEFTHRVELNHKCFTVSLSQGSLSLSLVFHQVTALQRRFWVFVTYIAN